MPSDLRDLTTGCLAHVLPPDWVGGADRELDRLHQVGGTVLLPTDPEWPPALRQVDDPPRALWIRGSAAVVGAPCAEARSAGYTCAEAKQAGYTCAEAKQAGYTCAEAKQGGYTLVEMKTAGYSSREAKQAGFEPEEAFHAGYSKDDTSRDRDGRAPWIWNV